MLGPAPCWFTREEVAGKVPFHVGVEVHKARPTNSNRITLELVDRSGAKRELEVDHVIAATGYKVGLSRISLFGKDLVSQISAVEDTPILSSNFESSVPGLYFVGITSANSFGPLLRFAVGANFASRRLSAHLARTASRRVVQDNLQLTANIES
jgi:thioredoxin reductase